MSIPAQLKYIVLSIMFFIAAISFTRTTLDILQSSKRLETLKLEVTGLEQRKAVLEGDVAYKKTDAFVEEKARNDLNLIKPGEKIYVGTNVLPAATVREETITIPFVQPKEKSNLALWYELFFK